jgi:hypothetical protein
LYLTCHISWSIPDINRAILQETRYQTPNVLFLAVCEMSRLDTIWISITYQIKKY